MFVLNHSQNFQNSPLSQTIWFAQNFSSLVPMHDCLYTLFSSKNVRSEERSWVPHRLFNWLTRAVTYQREAGSIITWINFVGEISKKVEKNRHPTKSRDPIPNYNYRSSWSIYGKSWIRKRSKMRQLRDARFLPSIYEFIM